MGIFYAACSGAFIGAARRGWQLARPSAGASIQEPARSVEAACFLRYCFITAAMHDLRMATKTISMEIDAYELRVRERRDPKESRRRN
jgi:hypothetical protein